MQIISKAKLRYLRIAPRKVRLLIDLIRGLSVEEAKAQLRYSKKDAAGAVLKLLNSAVANALNNYNAKEETLVVKEAYVDGGPILKRWRPRAFGRASAIKKRTSHVTIVLTGEAPEQKKKEVKNKEQETKKEEQKDTEKTDNQKVNKDEIKIAEKTADKKDDKKNEVKMDKEEPLKTDNQST